MQVKDDIDVLYLINVHQGKGLVCACLGSASSGLLRLLILIH